MKHAFTAAAAAAALLFGAGSAFAADIPVQKLDPALNAQLPQAIKDAGVIRNCVIGSFSPYTITRADEDRRPFRHDARPQVRALRRLA